MAIKEDIRFNDLVQVIDYLDQEEGMSVDEIKEYILARYDLPATFTNLENLIITLMDEE